MGQPYVGEIRPVGFNFAPAEWSMCNGASLPISQFQALFQLIGTTYGGDGQSNFALPNLCSRVPVHQGSLAGTNYTMGQTGGAETVTITPTTYPTHTHTLQGSSNTSNLVANPSGNAVASGLRFYSNAASDTTMGGNMISMATGGGQPHGNLQPYLALNWIISLNGIFPTQS
jgi:microcystin-dependent protein